MLRKLRLNLKRGHALEVTRIALDSEKLVYVLVADKKFRHKFGSSSVAYIGTTKKGAARVAPSAAAHAEVILHQHGVRKVIARIVTCGARRRVKTWRKLERAMLLAFRAEYGEIPLCNRQGGKIREHDEFSRYFSREAVRKRIQQLE